MEESDRSGAGLVNKLAVDITRGSKNNPLFYLSRRIQGVNLDSLGQLTLIVPTIWVNSPKLK